MKPIIQFVSKALKHVKKKPEIYVEMDLIFDNDYDVYTISKVLNIEPTSCQRKHETRISPITNKQNPGFWTLSSCHYESWELDDALTEIIHEIEDKIEPIKKICEMNSGKVKFSFVCIFTSESVPCLYFDQRFLDIVHRLGADIEFDMYVN